MIRKNAKHYQYICGILFLDTDYFVPKPMYCIRILFSLVYALGGFAIIYLGTYMFHRFFALLSLLFYCLERCRNDKELVGFAIIVALLFLQNYELMFSTSLFLVLYYNFINKLDYYDRNIYEIIKIAASLIVAYDTPSSSV